MKLKLQKVLRVLRNIINNLSKIIRNKTENTAIVTFLSRYKYILIVAIILLTFVGKNMYLIGRYSHDIKSYKEQVKVEEAKVKQTKEDLKYYNSDEFVYRYAMSELNMRPTKPSKWVHVKVFPKNEEDSDSEETSKPDNTESDDNTNTSEESNSTTEDKDSSDSQSTTNSSDDTNDENSNMETD